MADDTIAWRGQGVTRAELAANRAAGLKRCFVCDTTKSADMFSLDKSRSDGRQPKCKVCTNEAKNRWKAGRAERIAAVAAFDADRECAGCHQVKPAQQFREYAVPKKHRCPACMTCQDASLKEQQRLDTIRKAEWRRANPDWCKAYEKRWVAANPEAVRLKSRKCSIKHRARRNAANMLHRLKNGDAICARERAAYEANQVSIRKRKAKWHAEHTESESLRHKAYRAKNPGIMRAQWARRRASERCAEGSFTAADIEWLYKNAKGKCAHSWCRKPITAGYHIDHIMPLARGGSNDRRNLQLLCQPCNQKKHAKHPVDFAQQNGFLL